MINNTSDKIKVMLVDDSSVVRGFLTRIIDGVEDIETVGSFVNGQQAVDAVMRVAPDIIIMDIEMPVMDGITAVPKIIELMPEAKILMCSTLSTENADISMRALSLGAIDCIGKPTAAVNINRDTEFQDLFLYKIRNITRPNRMSRQRESKRDEGFLVKPPRGASIAKSLVKRPEADRADQAILRPAYAKDKNSTTPTAKSLAASGRKDIQLMQKAQLNNMPAKVLAIGSSTGGPQALFKFLKDLKGAELPKIPIVITQHMPAMFTKILAGHIESHTGLTAYEGDEGMKLEAGRVYVAPGGKHMLFDKKSDGTYIKLDDGPPESFCKPAVDPMLRSLVDIYGGSFVTVILTGMGADGLEGAKGFVKNGGRLVAQDEKTSVVWGMPGAVANAGLCMQVLPIDQLGDFVSEML